MLVSCIKSLLAACGIMLLFVACGMKDEEKQPQAKEEKPQPDHSPKFIHNRDAKVLPGWSKKNTVVFHVIGEPRELHPTNGFTAIRHLVYNYTQMYLVSTDLENLSARPGLARSMPDVSADGLEFTYMLRPEAKWDDGKQISAEDVAFTLKANICPLVNNPSAKPYFENIKEVRLYDDDPLRLTILMKRKYIMNTSFLADFPIMERAFYDSADVFASYDVSSLQSSVFNADKHPRLAAWAMEFNSAKYGHDPMYFNGMGAYRVDAWEQGQRIILVKKKKHWTFDLPHPSIYETSYPDTIVFVINTDQNSLMLEFSAMNYDGSAFLGTNTLLRLQENPTFNINYHSAFVPTFNYSFMGMNMKPDGTKRNKLFTDKRVRRAMALLTPVEDIITLIGKNKSIRMTGPVHPMKHDYNKALKPLPYDPAGAALLLDEAGWKDTDADNIRDKVIDGIKVNFEFDLFYMNVMVEWKDIAQMIAESMLDAGVKVNLRPLDPNPMIESITRHDFDAFLLSWSSDAGPDDHAQIWATNAWSSYGSNFTGFGNDESDALIDSMNVTLDPEKRKTFSHRFQEMVYEEQPYVFMMAGTRRIAIHKRFGNADIYYEKPGVIISNWRLLSRSVTGTIDMSAN